MTTKAVRIVEEQMEADDETTGKELQTLLAQNDMTVTSTTALRRRTELGYTCKPTSYCQMIWGTNKRRKD